MKRCVFLSVAMITVLLASCFFSTEIKAESVTWNTENATIKIGEEKQIAISVSPENITGEIKYTLSNSEIVEIIHKSNNGVIVKGLKYGSTVLLAQIDNKESYVQIVVDDELEGSTPYIKTTIAEEMKIGDTKTISVELYGVEEARKSLCEWEIENDNISVRDIGSSILVTASKVGKTRIEVSHPDCQYKESIMVYVTTEGREAIYLTTKTPVIKMASNGETENITVQLVGSSSLHYCQFRVVEGKEYIDIISNNNVCSITPKNVGGMAIIEASHPECEESIKIRVIVVDTKKEISIECEDFVYLDTEEKKITAILKNEEDTEKYKEFTYKINNENIRVTQVNNDFYLTPLKNGRTVLTLSSPYCLYPKEVYVIIGEETVVSDEYYITGEDIIKIEEGEEYLLNINLLGGTEADRNSFTWVVGDSSIFDIETSFGNVENTRSVTLDEILKCNAYVIGKGVGLADLIIRHPKVLEERKIKVKVYPKGTLPKDEIEVSGSGIVKVVIGETVTHGIEKNGPVSSYEWSIGDKTIAEVNGSESTALVSGIAKGRTTLQYESSDIKNSYEAIVLCAETEEELDEIGAIYVQNKNIELFTGGISYVELLSNGSVDFGNITLSGYDENICSVTNKENVLIIKGKESGETQVVIKSEYNSIVLLVKVEDEKTLLKPYYFKYDNFKGIVVGETEKISVDLVGANDYTSINWEVEDSSVVEIIGNGNECSVKAIKEGQTVLKATSLQSSNEAKIIIYTALTKEELESKVILYTEKTHYLKNVGESFFVEVALSDQSKKDEIEWIVDDIEKVSLQSSGNTAFIDCLKSGLAKVEVKCGDVSITLFISISEIDEENSEKEFSLPSIVEILTGSNITIKATAKGYSTADLNEITWEVSDASIIDIAQNGLNCYVIAKKSGICEIIVQNKSIVLEKKVLVVVKDTYEEFSENYVMNSKNSFYEITKGSSIDIEIEFGSSKPTDEMVSQLEWESSNSEIAQVIANGKKGTIKGINEGTASIKIKGSGFYNTVEIKIAVSEKKSTIENSNYSFNFSSMEGIVVGESKEIPITINGLDKNIGNSLIVDVEKEGILKITQLDNGLYVTALSEGETYVNIEYAELNLRGRIFIYCKNTLEEIESYYPLYTDKNYYIAGINDTVNLKIETINDESLKDIKWSISNTSLISYSLSSDKKEMTLKTKKEGVCTVTVTHPSFDGSIIFTVSITEYGLNTEESKELLTESIVFVKKGNERVTEVISSLTDEEKSKIKWTNSDTSIISIEGNGSECRITGIEEGYSEVTCSLGGSNYRVIAVYCYSDNYINLCVINNDRRYQRIKIGEKKELALLSKGKICDKNNYIIEDIGGNSCIEIEKENQKYYIKGINEGIAQIRVSNSDAVNTFIMYFEVKGEIEVEEESIVENTSGLLSIGKNVYVLDANDKINPTIIRIIPIEIEEKNYSSINWEIEDESIVSILPSGDYCSVYANKVGETIIVVSSPYAQNMVRIRIIVTEDVVSYYTEPYIYCEKTNIEIKSGETIKMECTLQNSENYDITQFRCSVEDESICGAEIVGNVLTLTGKLSGQTLVTLGYDDESVDDIHIVVSVQGVVDDLIYIYTEQSTVSIEEGSYKMVEVELFGYEELNSENYSWKVRDGSEDILFVSGTGNSVLVNGNKSGVGYIDVYHTKALFPLEIRIIVTDKMLTNPIYIKMENNQNVISLRKGEKKSLSCILENGSESSYNEFSYSNLTESLFSLYGASNQFLIEGKNEGTGRILIEHPLCLGSGIEVIVIVEKELTEDTLYIATESSLIEMKPSDSYKQITASIAGGKEEYNLLFSWEILTFESTIKNSNGTSNPVISLTATQNNAIIKPINEGEAIIRIKNSITSHYLDVTVLVSTYKTVSFGQSYVTVKERETAYVDVECPTGKTLIYEINNEKIASVVGTSKKAIIDGLEKGTCIIRVYCSDGSSSDELLVTVEENSDIVEAILNPGIKVVTLNTSETNGTLLECAISGSTVTSGDEENIEWKIGSGNTSIISFVGSSSTTIKGSQVKIIPKGSGEERIILSHSKCSVDRVIYVTVEQNSATLNVSSQFETMNKGDIKTITASVVGINDVDTNDIVWSVSDSSVAKIIGSNTGDMCNVEAVAKSGDCVLMCTYGNITKNVTLYVREIPGVTILATTPRVACGDTIEMRVKCTPEDSYSDVEIISNTSLYGVTSYYEDVENKEKVIKFTASYVTGFTQITAKLGDLTSTISVETTDNIYLQLLKYYVVENDLSIGKVVEYPTNIHCSPDINCIKIYYKTFPENISLLPSAGDITYNECKNPYGSGSTKFFTLAYGKDEEGTFIRIIPLTVGYGMVKFYNNENETSCYSDIPFCFTYDDYEPTLTSSGNTYSIVDFDNGILNLGCCEKVTFAVKSNSSYPYMSPKIRLIHTLKDKVDPKEESLNQKDFDYINYQISGHTHERGYRKSTKYGGIVTLEVSYPKYYGEEVTVKKQFLTYLDEWN